MNLMLIDNNNQINEKEIVSTNPEDLHILQLWLSDNSPELISLKPPTYFSSYWWLFSLFMLSSSTIIIYEYCHIIVSMKITTEIIILSPFVISLILLGVLRVGITKKPTYTVIDADGNPILVPSNEADDVSSWCYVMLCVIVILYGIGLCLLQFYVYIYYDVLSTQVIFDASNFSQFITVSSITFYSLHRIVRPSNRIDPLRTIFDLDIVEICLDAIDMSVLFQIIFVSNDKEPPNHVVQLTKISIVTWILSLSVRISLLYLVHLPTSTRFWKFLLKPTPQFWQFIPHWFSDSLPDNHDEKYYFKIYISRSMIALRFRAFQHLMIIPAEILAIITRVMVLSVVGFQFEQVELLWKNFTGLWRAYSAFRLYKRHFFTRNSNPVTWWRRIPMVKLIWIWCFIFGISYLFIGTLFDVYLQICLNSFWIHCFSILDILSVGLFVNFLKKTWIIHDHTIYVGGQLCLLFLLIIFIELNISSYRFPLLYYHHVKLKDEGNSFWDENGLLNVFPMIIIPYYAFHKSMKNVFLYNHEEWNMRNMYEWELKDYQHLVHTGTESDVVQACDPCHVLTAQSAIAEGVLDILSASTFFVMALDDNLPKGMQHTCLAFSILELLNGGVCFVASVGFYYSRAAHTDRVILGKAISRFLRWFIDTGSFIVRMIAWWRFGVIESPFMIKNLYHMIHAMVLMERAKGSIKYQVVPFGYNAPRITDWIGMKIQ